MSYVSQRAVRHFVKHRMPFKGSNIYGEWKPIWIDPDIDSRMYVVCSYGEHFPMYIYDPMVQRWYGNTDKYSSSTSRHQSCACPDRVDAWYDTAMMKQLARLGVVGLARKKILPSAEEGARYSTEAATILDSFINDKDYA